MSDSCAVRRLGGDHETWVVVDGCLTFSQIPMLWHTLIEAARRGSGVKLDLRRARSFDFSAAALVRDAKYGWRGLPRCEILFGRRAGVPTGRLLVEVLDLGADEEGPASL